MKSHKIKIFECGIKDLKILQTECIIGWWFQSRDWTAIEDQLLFLSKQKCNSMVEIYDRVTIYIYHTPFPLTLRYIFDCKRGPLGICNPSFPTRMTILWCRHIAIRMTCIIQSRFCEIQGRFCLLKHELIYRKNIFFSKLDFPKKHPFLLLAHLLILFLKI